MKKLIRHIIHPHFLFQFFLVSVLLLLSNFSFSQTSKFFTYKFRHKSKNIINSWEIGILAAETHYFGDLASYIPSVNILHLGGGMFVRYQYNPYWAFRIGYNQGVISGNDAYLYKSYFVDRSLNFE